jgi:chromosome segregation ATPase
LEVGLSDVKKLVVETNQKFAEELSGLKEQLKEQQNFQNDLLNRLFSKVESLSQTLETFQTQTLSHLASVSSSNSTTQQDIQFLRFMLKKSEEEKLKLSIHKEKLQNKYSKLMTKYQRITSLVFLNCGSFFFSH